MAYGIDEGLMQTQLQVICRAMPKGRL